MFKNRHREYSIPHKPYSNYPCPGGAVTSVPFPTLTATRLTTAPHEKKCLVGRKPTLCDIESADRVSGKFLRGLLLGPVTLEALMEVILRRRKPKTISTPAP